MIITISEKISVSGWHHKNITELQYNLFLKKIS